MVWNSWLGILGFCGQRAVFLRNDWRWTPGVARGWISQIELRKGNVSLDLLDRLAKALEVPVDTFWPRRNLAPPSPSRCQTVEGSATGAARLHRVTRR